MAIAILATGDEIAQGDTLNTNGYTIAQALESEGLSVGFHLTCRDQEQDIIDALAFLSQKHSAIILIGGLGPTSDDRTRFALGKFLNMPLIEFKQAMQHVSDRLNKANLILNLGHAQQCLFPSSATLFPNPNGSALGCSLMVNHCLFLMLPGPPRECLPMFETYALPQLRAHIQREECILLKWRLFGVAEGSIAEVLEQALIGINCTTGYRLETPYLEFKIRCNSHSVETIKQIIEPIISPYIISPPHLRASTCLQHKIELLQQKISIVDEVTGGILQISVLRPESKAWLTFQEDPTAHYRFYLSGLTDYWHQKAQHAGKTSITIHYKTPFASGTESHEIPYFSGLVVHYAAEWLSFRLLQLLYRS